MPYLFLFRRKKKPAKETHDIEDYISELGRRDIFGPNPAVEKLLEREKEAIPYLLEVLEHPDNVNACVDAIQILGELKAKEAIPKLEYLQNTNIAEIKQASLTALAKMKKKTTLLLDRSNPFQQIGELWTAIIQNRQKLYEPDDLLTFCEEAIATLPDLNFSSEDQEARSWGMLGSLYYKSINPEWEGGFDGTKPCSEAKRCYEEALRCQPGDDWWEQWVKSFS